MFYRMLRFPVYLCICLDIVFTLFSQIQDLLLLPPANHPERMTGTGQIYKTLFSHTKYKADSQDQRSKEESIVVWIGRAGLPPRTVEDEDFVYMIEKIEESLCQKNKQRLSNVCKISWDTVQFITVQK